MKLRLNIFRRRRQDEEVPGVRLWLAIERALREEGYPDLTRGALARVARKTGASASYVGQVARRMEGDLRQ